MERTSRFCPSAPSSWSLQILLAEGEADAFMPAVNGRFAALEAARNGHTACLELLLELGGIDVRQANDLDGAHPMLEAAAHGHLNALKVRVQLVPPS